MDNKADYEIVECATVADWRQWLERHYADTDGVWLKMYKKASRQPSIVYAEALDEALAFGWIDGLVKGIDEQAYKQKFTPRRKNSLWSKRNIERVERLLEAGLMKPAGLAEVERAKQDGRWQAAYDSFSQMTVPPDLQGELEKRPEAKAFFESLNKTNKYAILWRLQTAKTDATRQRRLAKVVAMLEEGQAFH